MAMENDKEKARFVGEFPHELNSRVLAQFSGAQTEPYTGHVAYILCRSLKLSVKGQRTMNNVLNNLPVSRTPDERLTFGWAEDNIIRSRLVNEGAYEPLAIMITLSEALHESYSARVMYEMAQMSAGHEDITPHFRQWKNVIRSVNGAFTTTDFGIVVEDYLRLDPYNVITGLNISTAKIPIHPNTVAKALLTLGKLTLGHEKQITVTGSAIISWLAAISDWLFDLRIAIFSDDGTHLHSTHPGQETQVLFVFTEKPGCHVSSEPWAHPDTHQATARKPSQPSSDPNSYSSSIHQTPFSGRVVWQSLLPRVFGLSFHHLDHEDSRPFAAMLGSAARLFESLAHDEYAETPAASNLISASNKTNTASYGPGLIETLTNWLPELRRFQGRMERQLKLTPNDAAVAYRESLTTLRKVCACGICQPLPFSSSSDRPSNPNPPPAPSSTLPDISSLSVGPYTPPHPAPKNGYCLPTLVETIVALGLSLSRTIVSPSLYPSRAGIQSLYVNQTLRRLAARGLDWTKHFSLIYGNEWNAPDHQRLVNTVQIFAGSRPVEDVGERGLVGVGHEGVCAYFVGLEKGGFGVGKREKEGEGVKLIRIVSGGINVRYKVFQRLVLGEVETEDWGDPWERVRVEHIDEVLCCK